MSDLIIPSGFGQATLTWQFDGVPKPFTIAFGYSIPSGSTSATGDATTIFGAWNSVGSPFDQAVMSDAVVFIGCQVKRNSAGTLEEGAFEPGVRGENEVELPIINSAILVSKKTGLVGRAHRGRMFVPITGGDEIVFTAAGYIGSTLLALLQGQYDNALDAMDGADITMQLLHSAALAPDPVTSLVVEPQVATQRRRLR